MNIVMAMNKIVHKMIIHVEYVKSRDMNTTTRIARKYVHVAAFIHQPIICAGCAEVQDMTMKRRIAERTLD